VLSLRCAVLTLRCGHVDADASHAVRSALAAALTDAAALLGGAVEAYLVEEECGSVQSKSRSDVGGATPDSPTRRGLPRMRLSLVAAGFSGVAASDGGDAGLALVHAELHSLEARLSRQLEQYTALLAHAAEERRVRLGDPLSVRRFTAAGTAVRAVFTGAVALLHGMEAGLHECALCAAHAPAIRAARTELGAAFAAAGALARRGSEEDARAAVSRLEAAVEALAAEVTAEVAWRRLVGPAAGGEGDAAAADISLRHNVQSLGAVCFALGDAARQVARIVADIAPKASHAAKGGGAEGDAAHADSEMVGAPGGAAPAKGGGGMGHALRGAAHALDGALHWQLAQRHGSKEPTDAHKPASKLPRSRTLSMGMLVRPKDWGGAKRSASVQAGLDAPGEQPPGRHAPP
jgi:hypothetical protein